MRTALALSIAVPLSLTLSSLACRPTAAPPGPGSTVQPRGGAVTAGSEETVTNPSPTTKTSLTIGIAMTWGHPYWQNMITGLKDEAAAQEQQRGLTISAVFQNAEEDATKQTAQCENFVTQGVDAVIMVPMREEASVRAVWLLNDANVPVILVNRTINDTTGRATWVCYTGTDTYEGAKVSAQLLMDAIGGAGEIAELQQVLGCGPQIARTQALEDVLRDYPNVRLVSQQSFGSDEAQAVGITQGLLGAHPELVGIYAHGDNAAMHALKAAEAAGRTDLKIVGMGGNKDALQAIREGRLVGTSYQQPYEEGRSGMRCAIAYLMGEPVKRVDRTPVIPVTRDNAANFEGQF